MLKRVGERQDARARASRASNSESGDPLPWQYTSMVPPIGLGSLSARLQTDKDVVGLRRWRRGLSKIKGVLSEVRRQVITIKQAARVPRKEIAASQSRGIMPKSRVLFVPGFPRAGDPCIGPSIFGLTIGQRCLPSTRKKSQNLHTPLFLRSIRQRSGSIRYENGDDSTSAKGFLSKTRSETKPNIWVGILPVNKWGEPSSLPLARSEDPHRSRIDSARDARLGLLGRRRFRISGMEATPRVAKRG